jgi:hypothetical protein
VFIVNEDNPSWEPIVVKHERFCFSFLFSRQPLGWNPCSFFVSVTFGHAPNYPPMRSHRVRTQYLTQFWSLHHTNQIYHSSQKPDKDLSDVTGVFDGLSLACVRETGRYRECEMCDESEVGVCEREMIVWESERW